MPNIKNIIILGLILLVALALRMYKLDKYDFWYDEATCAFAADDGGIKNLPSFGKLLDRESAVKDICYLKLYQRIFVYLWEKGFGNSESALRSSSVVFSLIAIILLYILAAGIFNVQTAHLASLLMAISPFAVTYAQELSPYSAVACFTLAALYSFLKILETGRIKYYLIYAFSMTLGAYFHYMSLLIVFAFLLFFISNLRNYKKLIKPLLLTHLAVLLLLFPGILTMFQHLAFILSNKVDGNMSEYPFWAKGISFSSLLYTLKNFSIGYNTAFSSYAAKIAMLAYSGLFVTGAVLYRKKIQVKILLYYLFVPVAGLFLISLGKFCYIDRYLFAVYPVFLLLSSAGLQRSGTKAGAVLTIALLSLSLFSLKDYYNYSLPRDYTHHLGIVNKIDAKSMAGIISDGYKEGDVIVHTCRNTVFPLKFYIRKVSTDEGLIREAKKGTVVLSVQSPDGKGLFFYNYDKWHPDPVPSKDFTAFKDLKIVSRVWVVLSNWHFKDSECEEYAFIKEIKSNYREQGCHKLDGANVYLFSK